MSKGSEITPGWNLVVLGALLVAVMALMTPYRGPNLEFPWALWAYLLALAMAAAALPVLLDAQAGVFSRRLLLIVACLLLWLLFVQRVSIAPDLSLGQTLTWCTALLVGMAARVFVLSGRTGLLLLIVLVPLALDAIVQGVRIELVGINAYGVRDRNTLGDGLFLGLMVVLGVLATGLATRAGRRALPLLGAGAFAVAAAVFVSDALLTSRAVVLMMLLALVLFAACNRDRRLWVWVLAGVAGLLAAPLIDLLPQAASVEAANSARSTNAGVGSAVSLRWPLLVSAVEIMFEGPLWGSGFSAFRLLFLPRQSPDFPLSGATVHNDFIQLGVELGVPMMLALFAFAWVVLRAWLRAVRASRVPDDQPKPLLTQALLLALLGVLGHGLINFPLHDAVTLIAVVVVAVAGLSGRTVTSAVDTTPAPDGSAQAARAASPLALRLGIALLASLLLLQGLQAGAFAWGAIVMQRMPLLPGVAAPVPTAAEVFEVAGRLRSLPVPGGRAAFEQGRILVRLWEDSGRTDEGLAEGAAVALAEAIARDPHVPEYSIQYARLLRERGAPLAPRIELLDEVISRQPRDARSYVALAAHLLQAGDETAASVLARDRWLAWCPLAVRGRPEESAIMLALVPSSAAADEAMAARIDRCELIMRREGVARFSLAEVRARFAPER